MHWKYRGQKRENRKGKDFGRFEGFSEGMHVNNSLAKAQGNLRQPICSCFCFRLSLFEALRFIPWHLRHAPEIGIVVLEVASVAAVLGGPLVVHSCYSTNFMLVYSLCGKTIMV